MSFGTLNVCVGITVKALEKLIDTYSSSFSILGLQELTFESTTLPIGPRHTLYIADSKASRKPGILLNNDLSKLIQEHCSNSYFHAILFRDFIFVTCHIRVSANTSVDDYASQLNAVSACVRGWPSLPVLMGGDLNTGFGTPFDDVVGQHCGTTTAYSASLLSFCIEHSLHVVNSFADHGPTRTPSGRQKGDPSYIDWLFTSVRVSCQDISYFVFTLTKTDHMLMFGQTNYHALQLRRTRDDYGYPTGYSPPALDTQFLADQLLTGTPLHLAVPTLNNIARDLYVHGDCGIQDDSDFDFDARIRELDNWYLDEANAGNLPSPSACFHKFFRADSYGVDASQLKSYRAYLRTHIHKNALLWKMFRYANRRMARARSNNQSVLSGLFELVRKSRKMSVVPVSVEHDGEQMKPKDWSDTLLQHYTKVYSASVDDPVVGDIAQAPLVLARYVPGTEALDFEHPAEAVRCKLGRRLGCDGVSFEVIQALSSA